MTLRAHVNAMTRHVGFGILLIMAAPLASNAAIVTSTQAKIVEVVTFSEYGGGDVVVKLETHPTECASGFWFAKAQPGFSGLMSMVLAAMHSGTEVIIRGRDDQIWAGSSGTFCKVYNVTQRS